MPGLELRTEVRFGTELDLTQATARIRIGPQPHVQGVGSMLQQVGRDGDELWSVPIARDRFVETATASDERAVDVESRVHAQFADVNRVELVVLVGELEA